ncbi:MAG: restriction endonuclease [Cytophagales bacterium]|nr:MAG: restriction endonuclease [Cytophagales bacterium]
MTDEDDPQTAKASLTWYDSRANQPHRSAEFRLYYTTDFIQEHAQAGDMLFVATREGGSVLVIVAVAGSTTESQLLHLFGVAVDEGRVTKKLIAGADDIVLNAATTYILDNLGIASVVSPTETESIRDMLSREFNLIMPTTKVFSDFVRRYLGKEVSPLDDPDAALMKYWQTETLFFKTIEKVGIEQWLSEGNKTAEDFLKFSLSIHQTRKSRAGDAFENHVEALFQMHDVYYSRQPITEHNNKPDFIFPSINAYHDATFPVDTLTMLAMKTTAKDRWRQALAEAERINKKHLATLEPSISVKQTTQMQARNLTLVVPTEIKATYKPEQHSALMTLTEFIQLVKERQKSEFFTPNLIPIPAVPKKAAISKPRKK